MPRGVPDKRYTAEFKQHVVEIMREEKLSYYNTRRKKTKFEGLPPALHRSQALFAA